MDDESKQTATSAEIRHMVGDVDDAVVSSIIQTGASPAEVLQAVQWFRGGGGTRGRSGPRAAWRGEDRIRHPSGRGTGGALKRSSCGTFGKGR